MEIKMIQCNEAHDTLIKSLWATTGTSITNMLLLKDITEVSSETTFLDIVDKVVTKGVAARGYALDNNTYQGRFSIDSSVKVTGVALILDGNLQCDSHLQGNDKYVKTVTETEKLVFIAAVPETQRVDWEEEFLVKVKFTDE